MVIRTGGSHSERFFSFPKLGVKAFMNSMTHSFEVLPPEHFMHPISQRWEEYAGDEVKLLLD